MTRRLQIISVEFDYINHEITIKYNNLKVVRIVRQFYTTELVGGTDEMRELARPIARDYNDFIQGGNL